MNHEGAESMDDEATEELRCGRPTKSGAPCKQPTRANEGISCWKHATDGERHLLGLIHKLRRTLESLEEESKNAYGRGWSDGRRDGKKLDENLNDQLSERVAELQRDRSEQLNTMAINHLESMIAELRKARVWRPVRRERDDDGKQIVECNGYAYRWTGAEPLEIGDKVWLPENWFTKIKQGPGSFLAEVTGFGTTYDGSLQTIVRKDSGVAA